MGKIRISKALQATYASIVNRSRIMEYCGEVIRHIQLFRYQLTLRLLCSYSLVHVLIFALELLSLPFTIAKILKEGVFLNCPICKKDALMFLNCLTNLHMTGDKKRASLYQCGECNRSFLKVSVDTWSSDFEFTITLKRAEAEEMRKVFKSCPEPNNEDCQCPAHNYLDSFDNLNTHRRFMIKDYYYSDNTDLKKEKRAANKKAKKTKVENKDDRE